ncbi:unnamed protein product [Cylindrotheca closterium]|uniref:Uncharacterized protein n=1 Tax=Cylindrotheca closterium TaxID=2856 RepID=A0AAD2FRW5_9STRA|nr:unnamed protein product [Cylindrotheca closterium]
MGSGNHSKKKKIAGKKDDKTPTQLRNARKRRKTKLTKQSSAHRLVSSSSSTSGGDDDPSLRYLSNPTAAPIIQQATSFFQEQGHAFEVKVGPTSGWRTVSKLAVRSQSGVLCLGLFAPGSHQLLEIPNCQAHHPRINSAIQVLQKQCRKCDIKPYDEQTGTGSLKYVAINIERSTGNQQVSLVWNKNANGNSNDEKEKEKEDSKLQKLCEALIKVSKNNDDRLVLHSLWVHYSNLNKYANSIFDRDGQWELKYGDNMVVEYLDINGAPKAPLHFPPQVFRQANIDAFRKIVEEIRNYLERKKNKSKPKRCVELYGGVGTIGLHIADLCETFVSSDENPFNKTCFEQTVAAMMDLLPGGTTTTTMMMKEIPYESKNAVDMTYTQAFRESNTIIVDPPRKGLDTEVADALCTQDKLKTLIYVSCGFAAFTRDYDTLTTKGKWKLEHAEGHVLFPGSDAIETLAFFSR